VDKSIFIKGLLESSCATALGINITTLASAEDPF
jgi:hypothetical protein